MQGLEIGFNYVTGQSSSGMAQPMFNLSPYYSNLFSQLLTKTPWVGGFFSNLPANLLSSIVDFMAGWILLGLLLFACFALLGKVIGVLIGIVVGGIFVAILVGLIKL